MMIGFLFNALNFLGSEWVMWILVALSIVSIAIIIERFQVLRNQEKVGAQLWAEQFESRMRTGGLSLSHQEASELVRRFPCLESEVVEVLVSAGGRDRSDLTLLMQSFVGRRKVELEKNLAFLGTLGSNAPFIGLFGTVLGIIKAFHDISKSATQGGAQNISLGLSEALVATAIGLLVAIPAVIFFNYFQRKIRSMVARTESIGNFIISSRR